MAAPKIDFTNSFIVNAAERSHLSSRSLPTAPDGRYDYEAAVAAGDSTSESQGHSTLYNVVSAVQSAFGRGPLISDSPFKTIRAVNDFLTSNNAADDRKGFFGGALAFITKLPPGEIQDKLNDAAITALYDTLPHPPATYIGERKSEVLPGGPTGWREADGGGNNHYLPDLGRAGRPYARSVQAKHTVSPDALPDAGLVFDTLLRANEFQPHPGRNSSLTFAFATLVTHMLFRTDPKDGVTNNTSSYLDLSPLYGCNQVMQDQVRDKAQGRGLLYPDTFSEERLFFVPPAASALLVCFSRNHNYIAQMLLKLNERKCWSDPPPADPAKRAQQDEEIFQTARNVNCGHLMSLVFGDYVAGFLGLGRDGNSWTMNPFDPITSPLGQDVGRGQGNHVSVEFNMLYRWHATTSAQDIDWTEKAFGKIFGGKNLEELTLGDFWGAAAKAFQQVDPDPKTREFGGIKRDPVTKMFSDDDLAGILHTATENVAGAYRGRGTPAALRIVEILGIEQARRWGVCTMNEFRKFLGLKPLASFKEWCSDEKVWRAAEQLYGHIDNLELYPGLQAEDCMALGPGSGLCCGYTMTRAILGDAIALVRGDRFYTTDYTPANLTAWGFQDCIRNPNNGAFGAHLPMLLMRALPNHYPANSAYTLFPFFTPEVTKVNLTKLRMAEKYEFSRPVAVPPPTVLSTITGVRHVLNDPSCFRPIHENEIAKLLTGSDVLTTATARRNLGDDKASWDALLSDSATADGYVSWIRQKTIEMVREKTFKYDVLPEKYVDVISDVINPVAVHWVAEKLLGISLKTTEHPWGLFTEQELYDMLTDLFTYGFENVDPGDGWTSRVRAQQAIRNLRTLVEDSLTEAAPSTSSNPLVGLYTYAKGSIWPKECQSFFSRLAAASSKLSSSEIVARALSVAVGASVPLAQTAAQVVNFYLAQSRAAERTALFAACVRTDKKGSDLVKGFVREAMRLEPPFAGVYMQALHDCAISQGAGAASLKVKKDDVLFASIKNAHLDASEFPNPTKVDPGRPKECYELQCTGLHGSSSVDFVISAVAEIVKVIFTLPNLHPAPGTNGVCTSITVNKLDTDHKMYVSSWGNLRQWPGSLQVAYAA